MFLMFRVVKKHGLNAHFAPEIYILYEYTAGGQYLSLHVKFLCIPMYKNINKEKESLHQAYFFFFIT